MPSVGKKLHHTVPRFYLKAWARKRLIFCLQDREIFRPNLQGVAAENYFYRLQELSPADFDFIRLNAIDDSPKGLIQSHEDLVHAFTLPYLAKRRLEQSGRATPEMMADIDQTITEMNENFHTAIEDDFQPHLASMLSGDLTFLEDPKKAAFFYRALAVQYLRTNHIRKSRLVMPSERLEMYLRIANVLVHILATNLGFNMYADRKNYTLMLLSNSTNIPFVTADQPVINIASNPKEVAPPKKFELYYPLSPAKALLILGPSSDFLPASPTIQADAAHLYNLRIAAHSYQQVFGSSRKVLESVRADLPAFLSCF